MNKHDHGCGVAQHPVQKNGPNIASADLLIYDLLLVPSLDATLPLRTIRELASPFRMCEQREITTSAGIVDS
jgi:hypothetical protein